ncbi:hypothetical protein MNBD_CHLOROFLEXI01-1719 [hydrothermal vent metagenome]|uniref:HEPN domain-containing protein n=1 Tax=hydrothermal vent metagenome TaxID=652676 RepID=A0A3B0W1D1_9ZZZZ
MELDALTKDKIGKYLVRARQALDTGQLVLQHEDYITAVNRAYYAIFYAANALLTTKGLERSKHSGVIAAFRQHFVKSGIIDPEFSRYYGEAMSERHRGDYEIEYMDHDSAERNLAHAERFVNEVENALRDMEVLK